jgi:hypothetical protein
LLQIRIICPTPSHTHSCTLHGACSTLTRHPIQPMRSRHSTHQLAVATAAASTVALAAHSQPHRTSPLPANYSGCSCRVCCSYPHCCSQPHRCRAA